MLVIRVALPAGMQLFAAISREVAITADVRIMPVCAPITLWLPASRGDNAKVISALPAEILHPPHSHISL